MVLSNYSQVPFTETFLWLRFFPIVWTISRFFFKLILSINILSYLSNTGYRLLIFFNCETSVTFIILLMYKSSVILRKRCIAVCSQYIPNKKWNRSKFHDDTIVNTTILFRAAIDENSFTKELPIWEEIFEVIASKVFSILVLICILNS